MIQKLYQLGMFIPKNLFHLNPPPFRFERVMIFIAPSQIVCLSNLCVVNISANFFFHMFFL